MKTILTLLTCSVLFLGCEKNACEIKTDINVLKEEVASLEREKDRLNNSIFRSRSEINSISQTKTEIDSSIIYLESLRSQNLRYILTIKGKQDRMYLSISEHVKDAMNAFTFEVPVDAKFYKSVNVGSVLSENFRTGSLILSGSWSDMELKVVGKRIVSDK